jgi:hypothetical protein
MISFPCIQCKSETEYYDLTRKLFFCNLQCLSVYEQCDKSEVIHSTKEIRRTPHIHCPLEDDQKCHIFGLNAAKQILNHYAFECTRLDDEALEKLIVAINGPSNIYCCSKEQNDKDKETERLFLDCFLYK